MTTVGAGASKDEGGRRREVGQPRRTQRARRRRAPFGGLRVLCGSLFKRRRRARPWAPRPPPPHRHPGPCAQGPSRSPRPPSTGTLGTGPRVTTVGAGVERRGRSAQSLPVMVGLDPTIHEHGVGSVGMDPRVKPEGDEVGGLEGRGRWRSLSPSWSGLTQPSMNTGSVQWAWTLGSSPRVTRRGAPPHSRHPGPCAQDPSRGPRPPSTGTLGTSPRVTTVAARKGLRSPSSRRRPRAPPQSPTRPCPTPDRAACRPGGRIRRRPGWAGRRG